MRVMLKQVYLGVPVWNTSVLKIPVKWVGFSKDPGSFSGLQLTPGAADWEQGPADSFYSFLVILDPYWKSVSVLWADCC